MNFLKYPDYITGTLYVLKKQRLLYGWLFVFTALLIISCSEEKVNSISLKEIIFVPDIHDIKEIFTADSLLFYEKEALAKVSYIKILKQNNLNQVNRQYIKSKLLQLSEDSSEVNSLYTDLCRATVTPKHFATCLQLSAFELNSGKSLTCMDEIRMVLNDDISQYYKGISGYVLARYHFERKNDLDSAWQYIMLARSAFENTKVITPLYQECLELVTSFCMYKRKNLLSVRFANVMFEFKKYFPVADSLDQARAFANRAFIMFRAGDFLGTTEDIESGLKLIQPNHHPELYQNLMKSYLAIYMLRGQNTLWQNTADNINGNIRVSGKDCIEMNRWYGQFYANSGLYQQAIPYLKLALQKEKEKGLVYSARYSTLCFLLSQCYGNLHNFSQALEYMAHNKSLRNYEINQMLEHLSKSKGYSFVTGLRCGNIYFSKYKHTGQLASLLQSKSYLDFLNKVMFGQFKVAEENAILQFYLESGQDYFHLGMEVCFELWVKTGEVKYREDYIQYSEKNKNSLMYRDIMISQRTAGLPDSLIDLERKLKSSIKREQLKGLRDNRKFNEIIEKYAALEDIFQNKFPEFFTSGLIMNIESLADIQKKIPDDSTTILHISEVNRHLYFSAISQKGISIAKSLLTDEIRKSMDSLLQIIKFTLPVSPVDQQNMSFELYQKMIPMEIRSALNPSLIVVPDGIFNRFPLAAFVSEKRTLPKRLTEIDYLHKQFNISYAPSVKMLQRKLESQHLSGDQVAIFAFSDIETIRSSQRTYLPELPGTYSEAVNLQKKYQGSSLFAGKQATKANFMKVYQDTTVAYIHLAVHGLANGSRVDDVKLYFRTNTGGLDSLYGYELLDMSGKAKKIVLSACQSGLGVSKAGEGNYSLPRYFMINGAISVIASLWDVSDQTGLDPLNSVNFILKN
ncbi:MAG: CHAT domain-containing protein [Saprospiraceae bacterium]|nr:CHAT domain-containing protein [Saprospiraceae bacterium]